MSAIDMTLGDRVTLKQLAYALQNGFSPIVEVESMDGIYAVRFHHANGVSDLCNAEGKVSTFLGTGEIRDTLGHIGLTHGVLTFADQCGDEMIGIEGKAMTPDEMLTYGTRISFR
ncbi:hypothetical protein [Vreelandella neptunia]|uniref:Uncharacterized protein n=1 Tax=Vreelandella neptunia TaxID=115551 RepID=A0ABS9S8C8_9GAMM|nr:hypothetical protein [Halomonas neptunia]MCH4812335.1 hypothetical protein [Halomonas neptunia]